MEKITLSRKELYDLVWSESILEISNRYQISVSIVKKICKDFIIPLPAIGYLEKKKFGKPVEIIPLSDEYEGSDFIDLQHYINEEQNSPQALLKAKQKEIEDNLGDELKLPEHLSNPDKLIVLYKQHLILSKKSSYSGWDSQYLSIRVKGEQLKRAILIMDTFIKAIKLRGHDIQIINSDTCLLINQEIFKISIREKTNRILINEPKYSWDTYEFVPSGFLVIKYDYYHAKEWYDSPFVPLEEKLSQIIAFFEIEAESIKIQREKSRLWHIEYERELKLKEEIKQRKINELKDFKRLLDDAHRWEKLRILRDYIAYIETTIKHGNNSVSYNEEWLNWANAKADWYDPSINLKDDILIDMDRNTL